MRHTTTAAAAVLLLALTACTTDADNPPAAASSKPGQNASTEQPADDSKANLEKSVHDYTAALFSGAESGYDLLSTRCQKQMTKTAWVTMAKGAHQQYGAQKATGVKVDQLSGDLARVSYGAGNIPQFEREGQSWLREGGTWRWDACPSTN